MTDNIAMWCIHCGVRLTAEETHNVSACPKCGCEGIPCDPQNDVEIEVNWHELRVLCIWAEFHAQAQGDKAPEMLKTVSAIASRLQRQFPNLTALTLSSELKDMKEELMSKHPGITKIQYINAPNPPPIPEIGDGAIGHSVKRAKTAN